MDKTKIQEKLRQLRSQTSKTKSFWKPESGKSVVRILPYKYSEDKQDLYPFVELWFHYDLGIKNAPVSLKTFGKPDPIIEMSDKLMKTQDDKNAYAMGKKLQPKMRVFAPVLVRGKENEGPKIWAFGKEVYMALLELIDDPEYGSIYDVHKGTDITVNFQTAKEAGRNFPQTKIQPKRETSPISNDKNVMKSINDMPNIHELYQDRTFDYDGLKELLGRWLNGEEADGGTTSEGTGKVPVTEVANEENEKETENETVDSGKEVENAANAFDELFG